MEKYYQWLQLHWLDTLIGFYIFFIVYSTIIPFDFIFSLDQINHRLHKIAWNPLYGKENNISFSDMIANIIFFMPLGILLALRKILKEYRNFLWSEWLQICATGAIISFSVEILQIFTRSRYPAINDIVMNTGGTFIGAACILGIYLKFRQQMKKFLLTAFAEKPEMILAGLFLVFIFLSQSAPFTFSLSLYSIFNQFQELLKNPIKIDYFFSNLLSNLIIYGVFAYFLFSGLDRYHSCAISRTVDYLIKLSVFFLPVFLEIFQFLLPERNHSIEDIHNKRYEGNNNNNINQIYFSRHLNFFKVISIFYFIFLFDRFFLPLDLHVKTSCLFSTLKKGLNLTWQFILVERVELVVLIVKEVFSFLPFGFILTRRVSKSLLLALIVLVPLFLHLMAILATGRMGMWPLEIPAAMFGIWAGNICWDLFKFLNLRER